MRKSGRGSEARRRWNTRNREKRNLGERVEPVLPVAALLAPYREDEGRK
jgi:hypothetical protein